MADTTDLGFPLFGEDDSSDIATKLSAISQALDDYLQPYIAAQATALANTQVRHIGEDGSTDGTTLNNAVGTAHSGNSKVTFTVPAGGRRYRIEVFGTFKLDSNPPGVYLVQPAYCPGNASVIGTSTVVGYGAATSLTTGAGAETRYAMSTVFLAAGTYTAFPIVKRTGGGSIADKATSDRVVVTLDSTS